MFLVVGATACHKRQVAVPVPPPPQPPRTAPVPSPEPAAEATVEPPAATTTTHPEDPSRYQVNKPPQSTPAVRKPPRAAAATVPANAPAANGAAASPAPAGAAPAAPAPAPKLGDVISADEQKQLNNSIDQSLSRAQGSLNALGGKQLNKDQQAEVEQIRKFIQQAQSARSSDPAGAKSLAERAEVLARDLAATFR